MHRRAFAVAATFVMTLAFSACDGPAQYSAIRVKILAFPDGTGEMRWSVPAPATDEEVARFGGQFAEALGLPPQTWTRNAGPEVLSGLPTDHLDIDFAGLMAVVERQWPDAVDSVFVSVCTPHAGGRASGSGVDLTHYDSCAIFVSDSAATDSATDSSARITFESRWHPAIWLWLWLVLAVGGGIAALALGRRRDRRWRPVYLSVAAAAPVVCLVIAFRAAAADTSMTTRTLETGIEFDAGFSEPLGTVSLAAFVAALLLVSAYVLFRTRRQHDPAGTSSNAFDAATE